MYATVSTITVRAHLSEPGPITATRTGEKITPVHISWWANRCDNGMILRDVTVYDENNANVSWDFDLDVVPEWVPAPPEGWDAALTALPAVVSL